ncbi:MAG TPA: HAD-IA family hydrolase, partial [Acidimicrobiia bacterium]
RDRFEVVVGGDDVKETKPDPTAYLIALERLRLGASSTVAVEDSPPGLGAARAAGVTCVVVVNDYTRGGDFAGAALVVEAFSDLDVPTLQRLAGTHPG